MQRTMRPQRKARQADGIVGRMAATAANTNALSIFEAGVKEEIFIEKRPDKMSYFCFLRVVNQAISPAMPTSQPIPPMISLKVVFGS